MKKHHDIIMIDFHCSAVTVLLSHKLDLTMTERSISKSSPDLSDHKISLTHPNGVILTRTIISRSGRI